jgi:hypothetical protein
LKEAIMTFPYVLPLLADKGELPLFALLRTLF